jgi:hypothetical protein
MVGNITGTEKMVVQILGAIDQVVASYYRLVLVVAPFGAGKTAVLREVASQRGYPYINVSLELSRAMLELTQVQRCLYASRLIEELAARAGGSCILLDNLGLLFEPSLKQDPLRLLKQLSRHRTVVAAWDGIVKDGHLICAEPGHPEYRRYPVKNADFVIVEP